MARALQKLSYGRKRKRTTKRRRKRRTHKRSRRKCSTRKRSRRPRRRFGQAPPQPQQVIRMSFIGRKKRKSSKSRRRRTSRRTKHRTRRRFGRMPNGQQIMGNFRPPAEMSTFQSYTGMGDGQTSRHLRNIDLSDRANFYSNV